MTRWRAVAEFPSYEVSEIGNIRRIEDGRMMSPKPDQSGYARVTLTASGRKYYRYVHRMVAIAFLGEPGGLIACHINGDKLDNRAENLRFGTHQDNRMDAVRHGTASKGGPRFDAPQRAQLRQAAAEMGSAGLSRIFGISRSYARFVRSQTLARV